MLTTLTEINIYKLLKKIILTSSQKKYIDKLYKKKTRQMTIIIFLFFRMKMEIKINLSSLNLNVSFFSSLISLIYGIHPHYFKINQF